MPGRVAIVTDSTASIPADQAGQWGVLVVPVRLRHGEWSAAEHKVPKETLAKALRNGANVATAPPDPATFLAAYNHAARNGASEIVSVHVSGSVSQSCEHARQAAQYAPVPVHVIDSKTSGMSLGYAVLSAARVAGAGGNARRVADALEHRLAGST